MSTDAARHRSPIDCYGWLITEMSRVRRSLFLQGSRCGHRSGSILALATLMVLLGAPSIASAVTSRCEARAIRAHQTLFADRLDNWEPLDDRTLLIWTRRSVRAHLIRLEVPLAGLREADVVHLVDGDRDRVISPCGQDGVTIGDGAGGWQVARIVSIELLSKKRTAELDSGTEALVASAGGLRI